MKKKKKLKKKCFLINLKPYSQDCFVIVDGDFGEFIKFLKKQKNERAKETLAYIQKKSDHEDLKPDYKPPVGGGCLYTKFPHGYVMIISRCPTDWIETVGIVVHESLHLTQYVLHRSGMTLSPDSDEAYTYFQEYIVEKILRKIWQNT